MLLTEEGTTPKPHPPSAKGRRDSIPVPIPIKKIKPYHQIFSTVEPDSEKPQIKKIKAKPKIQISFTEK